MLARFRYEPRVIGLRVTTLTDEMGIGPMKGVIIRPTPGEPLHAHRVIRMWSDTVCSVDEEVMSSSGQLRREEPLETMAHLCNLNQKKHSDRPDRMPLNSC